MKKINQETLLFNEETVSNKDLEKDKIKTTNVNILLNRVRLDEKRALRKKIIFSLFLAAVMGFISVYFII